MQELSDQRSKVLTEYELRFRCIIESKDLKDIHGAVFQFDDSMARMPMMVAPMLVEVTVVQ